MTLDTASPQVWGPRRSRLLRAWLLGPNYPTKLRLYYALRSKFDYPRLLLPYFERGWITLDERDFLQREILVHGWYEREVWDTLARFAEKDEVFWDVGAHIGGVSIRGLLDPRIAAVHSFEPDPAIGGVLAFNLALNRPAYELHHVALSDTNGTKLLHRGPHANTGLGSLQERHAHGRQTVEITSRTADSLIREGVPAPTLMKIDVEDSEVEVLHGALNLCQNTTLKAIVFEGANDARGALLDTDLAAWLNRMGYTVQHIPRLSHTIEKRENYLAFRLAVKA